MRTKRGIVAGLLVAIAATAAARTFVHPGIDCSQADIDRARAMVDAGREPWASSFAALRDCRTSDPAQDVPDYGTSLVPDRCNATLGHAGRRAHDLALLWHLTDDARYADKAVAFINASSHYDSFDLHGTASLDYGKAFLLCEAAELVRDYPGWAADDRTRFARILRERFYPILKNGDAGRFGNQGLFAFRAVLSMAVFLEDEKMYDRVWRYLTAQPHRADDDPYEPGPPKTSPAPVEADDFMETFKIGGRRSDIVDYGYDEQLRHYIYANGQCQESSRDQAHVMAGLFMYVAIAETFWLQGDDLYGALDDRILKGLEWSYRYNLSAWEPSGFTDAEGDATFENGVFYRARHRSGRWRSLAPSPKLRGALGTEGAPPHWFYEWSGWGTLMKRRTAWMAGDPPNGIHALPGTIAAREMDVNPARAIKPSFTVSSQEGRAYALTVGYRSSSAAEIAFSCDGSPAITVKLPANATRGIVQSPRPLAVPAGASVIRWALVSGAPDFQLVGLQLK